MPTRKWNFWRPNKLDKYVFEEIAGIFLGACTFVIFILLMFQGLRLAEFFIIHNASGVLLSQMAFFMSVSFLPVALPLAFLMAVLIGFGRLSADSELIAMKASGISTLRLSVPVWFLATLIVGISMSLNLQWVPWAEVNCKNIELKIGNTRAVTAIREGTFTSGFFNLLIFSDRVDIQTNRLHHVFIFDQREVKNPMTYVAEEAEIIPVKPRDLGAAIMLRLYDGSMHHSDLETHTYERMDFKTYHLYLQIEGGKDGPVRKLQMLTYPDLLKEIEQSSVEEFFGKEFRGEYWRRFSTAISPWVFVLLGIGLGTFRYRTAKAGAILTGVIILICYWMIQTYGVTALQRGTLSPFLGMQLANLVMLIAGLFSFRRAIW